MAITFTAPNGEVVYNPDETWLASLVETAGEDYWEVGSGDAGLRFETDGRTIAEMILVVRAPYGVLVHHLFTSDRFEYVARGPGGEEQEVTIRHGGDPWTLPRVFFVPRGEAVEVVKHFLHCGGRSPKSTWTVF